MFLTAVTWWEIDNGYRPRDLVHRYLSARLQSKKTPGKRLKAPHTLFRFHLKRGIFLHFFFTIFMFIQLTNRVYVSPSTFIRVSVWRQRETTKMINSFFNIQKLKLLTPCYKFSSIPTATKSLLSLFAGEFFFSSQDRCRLFQSSLFSSSAGGGGGGGLLPYCMVFTGMCRWTGYGFCDLRPKQGT